MSNSRKVLFFDIDGTLLYAKGSGRKAFQDAFYETYKIPINIDHINFSGATDLGVINKLLVETDSPYLSPEPLRGKTNNPSNLIIIAKKLAEINSIPLDVVCQVTSENTSNLFSLNS